MVITPIFISSSCILCQGSGTLDYDAFIELFEVLSRIQGSLKGVCLYCDFVECDSTLGFHEELRIIEYVRERLPQFEGSKWAFVTDSLLLYGLARMGQILASDFPLEYSVFRDSASAMNWLGRTAELSPMIAES